MLRAAISVGESSLIGVRECGASRGIRGFTIIELLITLAVTAILVGVAVPSFTTTVSGNRAYSVQAELASSLSLARSEATRRGVPVYVSAAAPVAGNEFGGGWNVWVDQNGDGNFDSSEPVLRAHEAIPPSVKVKAASTSIGYSSMGFLTPSAAVAIRVCADNASLAAFTITVQPNGLADVQEAGTVGQSSSQYASSAACTAS